MRPFRSTLFTHQDGVALGMILCALDARGALDRMLELDWFRAGELAESVGAAPGYLNIALRCLASQGYLDARGLWGSPDLRLGWTDRGRLVAPAFPSYVRVAAFVRTHLPIDRYLTSDSPADRMLEELVKEAAGDWGLLADDQPSLTREAMENCVEHLDGCLVVPLMTALKRHGMLESERLVPLKPAHEKVLPTVVRLLTHEGWIEEGTDRWTQRGLDACRYALHYGLMGSYLPMMSNLEALLFEDARQRTHGGGDEESHVDRRLNVLASGAAHESYFSDSDAILRDVFNGEPLADQPRFVADMGCGDGSWLIHIHDVVKGTLRGRHLEEHPLLMVGADYNEAALDVTRERLAEAGIEALVLRGDIGDPGSFAKALAEHGVDARDGLHIRSFIDHNRRYLPPTREAKPEAFAPTGTYVDEDGAPIPAADLEQNLVEHLTRWRPLAEKHGLVIFESHTVEPRIAARHVAQLHSIAFDTYHGYSNQYCVEFEVFMRAAAKAGLRASSHHQLRYPSRLPFVAISLNRFLVKTDEDPIATPVESAAPAREGEWSPTGLEDMADGEALHRFLYVGGDPNEPRRWASGSTGVLVRLVLDALFERIEAVRRGEHEPSIRLVDYGTGTGFATIELIKAGRERGLFAALDSAGIDFQVHLMDLPSGWFAKGYELLAGQPFTHFHSLRDAASGRFLPLDQVLEPGSADVIVASMVFHLIPDKAMPELVRGLAAILRPDGEMIWNTPDTGPPSRGARLFHEPNRRVRQAALQCIDNELLLRDILGAVPDSMAQRYAGLEERLREVRETLTPERRAACEARANRQILPRATELPKLEAQLGAAFEGACFTKTFEMRMQDTIDAILIPSNQRCLAEIEDFDTRARLSELLMRFHVLPTIYAGPAATTYGFNLHWTFGRHRPAR